MIQTLILVIFLLNNRIADCDDRVCCFLLTLDDFYEYYDWDHCDLEQLPNNFCCFIRMQAVAVDRMSIVSMTGLSCAGKTENITEIIVTFSPNYLLEQEEMNGTDVTAGFQMLYEMKGTEIVSIVRLFVDSGDSVQDYTLPWDSKTEYDEWEAIASTSFRSPLHLTGEANQTTTKNQSVTIDLRRQPVQVRISFIQFSEFDLNNITKLDRMSDHPVRLFGEWNLPDENESNRWIWITGVIMSVTCSLAIICVFLNLYAKDQVTKRESALLSSYYEEDSDFFSEAEVEDAISSMRQHTIDVEAEEETEWE